MKVIRTQNDLILDAKGTTRRIACREEFWKEMVKKFIEIGGSINGDDLIEVDGCTREGLYLLGFIDVLSGNIKFGRTKCTPRLIGRHDCRKVLEKLLKGDIDAVAKKQV